MLKEVDLRLIQAHGIPEFPPASLGWMFLDDNVNFINLSAVENDLRFSRSKSGHV